MAFEGVKVKYCPQCGAKNLETSKFCENCGAKFGLIEDKHLTDKQVIKTMETQQELPRCPYCHSTALAPVDSGAATAAKLGGHHPLGKLGNSVEIIQSYQPRLLCMNCGKKFLAGQKTIADVENAQKKAGKRLVYSFLAVVTVMLVIFAMIARLIDSILF